MAGATVGRRLRHRNAAQRPRRVDSADPARRHPPLPRTRRRRPWRPGLLLRQRHSAVRRPARGGYAVGLSDGADVEMRVSATARHPGGVLSQFDIGFDMSRRDQIELVGTDGHITVADPWICGAARVELVSGGCAETLSDPNGAFALTGTESDVYRIEIDSLRCHLRCGGTGVRTSGRARSGCKHFGRPPVDSDRYAGTSLAKDVRGE